MSKIDFKEFPLLADLSEQDLEALSEVLEEKSASAGVALFREGSEAEGLVLITSGKVSVESRRSSDRMSLGAGEALAAVSLFVVGPHEATAIAECRCNYLLLPRTAFCRLSDDAPRTACRLAESVVSELADVLREGLSSWETTEDASDGAGDSG